MREAIIEYSSVGCICTEILPHVMLGNTIDRGYMQTIIDRDLLGLLPPARERGNTSRHRHPPTRASRNTLAIRRAEDAKMQSLYSKNQTECPCREMVWSTISEHVGFYPCRFAKLLQECRGNMSKADIIKVQKLLGPRPLQYTDRGNTPNDTGIGPTLRHTHINVFTFSLNGLFARYRRFARTLVFCAF